MIEKGLLELVTTAYANGQILEMLPRIKVCVYSHSHN